MKTNIVKITTETNDIPNFISNSTLSTTVWFSGCHGKCKNCQNYNLIIPTPDFTPLQLSAELTIRKQLTDWVVLSGGDPFWGDNKYTTAALIKTTKELGYNIYIYTGYEFDIIKDFLEKRDMLKNIEYIKCGVYKEDLLNNDYLFASTNQSLYNNKGEKVYYFKNGKIINNLI